MRKFYDTSSLLTLGDALFKDGVERWCCSSVTLEELENIKTSVNKSDDVKFKARKLTRLLNEHPEQYEVIVATCYVRGIVDAHKLPVTNDNLILACASSICSEVVYSEDLAMRNIGKHIFGLNMQPCRAESDQFYTGCRTFTGDEDDFIVYMANLDKSKLAINEYLVFNNTATDESSEMRFDGNDFVALKLPPSSYIKAKTSYQRCALDMLMNDNITICAILGGYGSGKSYMATQMAFYDVVKRNKREKVLGIREPRGEGKDVGFLPGTLQDKVTGFFAPIAQQIAGGQYALEDYMRRGVLETNIPYYLKGTTYNDTVMVVDEAEDLSEAQLRLVGTRVGENSRIFFAGDYQQSLLDKSVNNPLVRMCNELRGNPQFACVYLNEDVRSETSKLFANLFKG